MPPIGQHASGSAAYRPTSLDFINLPNPIEPHTQAQKHPLNGTPRLEKARLENSTNQDLFKLILEPCNERPPKRQKATDNTLLDLPKLPVRNSAKRLRIPPTLSGLHQPPPDAGLLPSISVEQPQVPPPRQHDASVSHRSYSDRPVAIEQSSATQNEGTATGEASKLTRSKPQRNKWTDSETADLLKGVAQFGIGSWTKIVNCPDYQFHRRTALDLKDRFRVCCPEHYNSKKKSKKNPLTATIPTPPVQSEETVSSEVMEPQPSDTQRVKGPASERLNTSQLKDLGIDEPFTKSGRRARHGYSEAEDKAILRGFQKYGKSWSSIRKDASLNLSSRNPRDLRDRMRTRYPEEYAKAGLALPAEKHANKRETGVSNSAAVVSPSIDKDSSRQAAPSQEESYSKDDTLPRPTKRPPQHSIFTLDDIFLNGDSQFHDNEYMEETEPIVLDRGILDWAPRISTTANNSGGGIDPLMTLKLPKPVATATLQQPTVNQDRTVGTHHLQSSVNSMQNLPSLAELLPGGEQSEEGHLVELPSLVHLYHSTSMDEGGRNGILSLEDLIS